MSYAHSCGTYLLADLCEDSLYLNRFGQGGLFCAPNGQPFPRQIPHSRHVCLYTYTCSVLCIQREGKKCERNNKVRNFAHRATQLHYVAPWLHASTRFCTLLVSPNDLSCCQLNNTLKDPMREKSQDRSITRRQEHVLASESCFCLGRREIPPSIYRVAEDG